jgi:hypothetical protein
MKSPKKKPIAAKLRNLAGRHHACSRPRLNIKYRRGISIVPSQPELFANRLPFRQWLEVQPNLDVDRPA